MYWVEDQLEPVLRHRREGHFIRFNARSNERGEIYCVECKEVICDGARSVVDIVFECTLQHPRLRR
jgi:hypothetical protein